VKEEIRKRIKSLRTNSEGSEKIIKKLIETTEFRTAGSVLLYMPINNEVDTRDLFQTKKFIALPVIKDNNIIISRAGTEFKKGMYNVLEPEVTEEVKPDKIDLAIVPGLAFDRKGNRIGYGKGYYDRLLEKIRTPKIALAYSYQMVEKIPAEPHDIQVNIIITEKEVIHCD